MHTHTLSHTRMHTHFLFLSHAQTQTGARHQEGADARGLHRSERFNAHVCNQEGGQKRKALVRTQHTSMSHVACMIESCHTHMRTYIQWNMVHTGTNCYPSSCAGTTGPCFRTFSGNSRCVFMSTICVYMYMYERDYARDSVCVYTRWNRNVMSSNMFNKLYVRVCVYVCICVYWVRIRVQCGCKRRKKVKHTTTFACVSFVVLCQYTRIHIYLCEMYR